jgi:starch-binding outer membrane protein, SusD/RagB family
MKKLTLALSASLVLAAGCDTPTVTNENSPTVEALQGALTLAGVQTLAYGVLASDRNFVTSFNYTTESEIFARDAYRIDPNEPRYVTETLGGTPDPGSFSGSGAFSAGYTTIRSAITLIDALPGADKNSITDAQRLATTGFIQTIKALEYYRLLEVRDTIGVAILTSDPNFVPPLSCKKTVMDYIAALLDSANTNLVAAGSASLPFALPTGFTAYGRNYRSAANLVLLNRGLKGKVDVYRGLQHQSPTAGAFTAAITELTQALGGAAPGTVSPSTFGNGAYVTFVAGGTENTPNPLFDSRIGVNPKAQAALQAGDTRSSKIVTRPGATVAAQTLAGSGLSTTLTYVGSLTTNTANQTRPMAILRDEEIVLLRAQAYYEAGNFTLGDLDLNSVRTSYGLPAVVSTAANYRANLLYEKRYSLFFESPQRLVDLRAYGLLKAGITPAELPSDPFNTALPIPKSEADARGNVLAVTCG